MKKLMALVLALVMMLSCAAFAEAKLAWYGPYSSPYVEEVKSYVEQFAADTGVDST